MRWLPFRTRLAASLALAAAALLAAEARAATACKDVSCSTVCTPGAPVGISPLIPTSAFEAFRIANGWPAGPTPIAFADPGDNRSRRLVAAKQGAILVWDGATSALLNTPFLDLRDSPEGSGPVYDGNNERGLLAMAADPDYLANGRLYVLYTRGDGDVVIARYTR